MYHVSDNQCNIEMAKKQIQHNLVDSKITSIFATVSL